MDTKQITTSDIEWTDRGDYLSIGTVMEQGADVYVISVVQAAYRRGWAPLIIQRFSFLPSDGMFIMFDEDGENLGLVTDIRKAALDEWESREQARAEASL